MSVFVTHFLFCLMWLILHPNRKLLICCALVLPSGRVCEVDILWVMWNTPCSVSNYSEWLEVCADERRSAITFGNVRYRSWNDSCTRKGRVSIYISVIYAHPILSLLRKMHCDVILSALMKYTCTLDSHLVLDAMKIH